MSAGIRYGNVALGVESAQPALAPPLRQRPRNRFRRLLGLLAAALKRWA
jgi:hypothetical protein